MLRPLGLLDQPQVRGGARASRPCPEGGGSVRRGTVLRWQQRRARLRRLHQIRADLHCRADLGVDHHASVSSVVAHVHQVGRRIDRAWHAIVQRLLHEATQGVPLAHSDTTVRQKLGKSQLSRSPRVKDSAPKVASR